MADNNDLQQEAAFPQRDLQIHSIGSYTLDLDANKHTSLEATDNEVDYMNFIHGIVHEISTQGGRQFICNSMHTEVVGFPFSVLFKSSNFC